MPELPEVETTRRGIEPHVIGRTITGLVIRERRLRWPVPARLSREIVGKKVERVRRRGKYLLMDVLHGSVILHLGMSGSLRVLKRPAAAPGTHDHVDLLFDDVLLRLRDPRRFGALLWQAGDSSRHKLIAGLGVEPLEDDFSGEFLFKASRGRRVAIKQFLMNATMVVGVGNIYASEALFRAGIHPLTPAGRLSRARLDRLADAVRATLNDALASGGSTLRDFVDSEGKPGYFQNQRLVYDREGAPCRICAQPIRMIRQGQRSTFFCARCQTR